MRENKPKLLDLEEEIENLKNDFFDKIEDDEYIEDIIEKSLKKYKNYEEMFGFKEMLKELIKYIVNEILLEVEFFLEQRIKQACEFFLLYYNNADEFIIEQEKLIEQEGIEIKDFSGETIVIDKNGDIINYNEWLFRLAFKDVLENGEGGGSHGEERS